MKGGRKETGKGMGESRSIRETNNKNTNILANSTVEKKKPRKCVNM
jgi:hypothetical protein